MFQLLPKNTRFFDQFDRAADYVAKSAEYFYGFLDKFEKADVHAAEIKRLEHAADDVTHETMEQLHNSFITPIERGDIRRLIKSLDDILDFVNAAANRIALYEIRSILPEALTLAKVLVDATKSVKAAVENIRQIHNTSKREEILRLCIEINKFENEGDHIFHRALARLFKSGMDPLLVIQWKEIFEDIETATDRCEDVANILEGILLENT